MAASAEAGELEAELSVLTKLNHPSVVCLFGVVDVDAQHGGGVALVLEYCARGSLDQALRRQTFEPAELLRMSKEIGRGLQYLQVKGVLHRDLAARNVLLGDSGSCKLTDFGLARSVDSSGVYTVSSSVPVRWTAQEVLKKNEYSSASDVYAFAITIWEMYAGGALPFAKHEQNFAVAMAVGSGERPRQPASMPDAVLAVVAKCWATEPSARPTAAAAVGLLEALGEIEISTDVGGAVDRSGPSSPLAGYRLPNGVDSQSSPSAAQAKDADDSTYARTPA